MKRLIAGIGVMTFLGLSGCATDGYVHSQTDPLKDHIIRLERRINALEAASNKPAVLSDADAAAIKQANDKAQQALDATGKLSVDVSKANEAAKNADMAAQNAAKSAQDAETAAQNAKNAEMKSEKLFKLEQKK